MTTASQIVNDALELACIIDPNEEADPYLITRGFNTLNSIIEEWSGTGLNISTYTIETINLTTSTYQYTISTPVTEFLQGSLIDSDNVQSLLVPADLKLRNTFNFPLSLTGPARPKYCFVQNDAAAVAAGNSTLFFYDVPDKNYTATLYLKLQMPDFTLSNTITNIQPFFRKPLTYQLALELSIIFSSVLPDRFDAEYDRAMTKLRAAIPHDMSAQNGNELATVRRFRPWGAYVG